VCLWIKKHASRARGREEVESARKTKEEKSEGDEVGSQQRGCE